MRLLLQPVCSADTSRHAHLQATAEVLDLAASLPRLQAFVHVSTAFANGHQPPVGYVASTTT